MPHFFVHLDYETSERAGAGGMFQVASIEDDDGNDRIDRTDLVDQGYHYRDLDELKADIAKALEVDVKEIDLTEE